MLTSHAVLAIQKLNEDLSRRSHSAVVLNHHIFQRFHQSARNITSVCRLNSGIDDTFSTAHSVEVELRRCKAAYVRVFDETS